MKELGKAKLSDGDDFLGRFGRDLWVEMRGLEGSEGNVWYSGTDS